MDLTTKQKSHLRSLAHHLKPVVQIGQEGVTEGVLGAVDSALTTHELIKVKVGESPGDRQALAELADKLADETDSALVQVIGKTVVLYRRHPDKPRIKLK